MPHVGGGLRAWADGKTTATRAVRSTAQRLGATPIKPFPFGRWCLRAILGDFLAYSTTPTPTITACGSPPPKVVRIVTGQRKRMSGYGSSAERAGARKLRPGSLKNRAHERIGSCSAEGRLSLPWLPAREPALIRD
jgi:hypothetical protein